MDNRYSKKNSLRQQAEKQLAHLPSKPIKALTVDKANLEHELQVHQVELQMQNEELRQSQESLQEALSKYQDLFESAPIGYLVLDTHNLILDANQTAAQILGKTKTELSDKRLPQFIAESNEYHYYQYYYEMVVKTFNDRKPQEFDLEMVRGDDSHFFAHLNIFPVQDKQGKFNQLRVALLDISERKKAEEILLYDSQLLHQISDPVIATDVHFNITLWNKAAERTYGWTREEVLGKNVDDLLKTQFIGLTREEATRRLLAYGDIDIENIHSTRRGQNILDQSRVSVLKNKQGEIIGTLGVLRDITERKRAEETIKRSEERLRQYFHLGLVGMAIESPAGEWVEVNDRLCEIFGYDREEFLRTDLRSLVHPDDLPTGPSALDQMLQGKIDHYYLSKRYLRKDGQVIHAIISGGCARYPNGDISSIFLLVVDITAQKKVEAELSKARDGLEAEIRKRTEELRESEEKYRLLIENAGEAISVGQGDRLKLVNRKWSELTGYSEEEITSITNLLMIHPNDHKLIARIDRCLVKGKAIPSGFDMRLINKNGEIKWVKASLVKITWKGQPAVLGMLTDITEQKSLEQALREYAHKITKVQEEERKRIAFELHDDTAQYLGILKMQIGALADSEEIQSSKIRGKLKFLERDADRAYNDVRRYSHELRPVVLEHMGLAAALEQIAEDYNKLEQLAVDVHIEGKEPELSEEVKLGFFRIAQEALNNSRKHAKASLAQIDMKFSHQKVSMTVSDNGIGFDKKEVDARGGDKGSLGLMSMRERADLINANLKIVSRLGKGTRVVLKARI